jgi:hypothetical protein
MSEQSGNSPSNNNSGNRNPRHNNNRRRHHNNRGPGNPAGQNQNREPNANRPASAQGQPGQGQPQNRPQGQTQGHNRRPHHHNRNRPRPENRSQGQPQQHGGGGFNFERIYEKYLNLLDQHIVARRKYHDLFYRADPNQKIKLEKNFYNTLNDVREFENRLAPDVRDMFEKRNNGLRFDRTYTSNHEIPIEGDTVPDDLPPADPHFLQSQKNADYSHDTEESVGTAEDYLKYKGL